MDAHAYLARAPMRYMDMLDALENLSAKVLYQGDDGVALSRAGLLYLTGETPAVYDRFRPFLPDAKLLLLHEDFLVPELRGDPRFSDYMACHQCIYEPRTPVPYELPAGASIRMLTPADVPLVAARYETDEAYVAGAVERGMFGAVVDGVLAGFIGTHDEGTMGMLQILPEYRRHHLAFALEAHLINHLVETKRPYIYCHVDVHNDASLHLQKRLGEVWDGSVLHWFW